MRVIKYYVAFLLALPSEAKKADFLAIQVTCEALSPHVQKCPNISGWSVTRKTEEPTENSKTRTEPKPKITDFSKTEPNRNRIQKPRLTEKGHF